MADPTPPPPAASPARGWLPWLLVGALAIAVAVLVTVLLLRDDATTDAPDVTPTPTEEGPSASPEPSPEPEPSDEPTSAMPLLPPEDHFPADGTSAIPLSEDSLEDGDYFGFVIDIDVAGQTIDADIAIFYSGQAAIDYLTENDPAAENPPPNDYIIVNDVERIRTLDVSPDVRIWDWCYGDDVELSFLERADLGAWAAAPMEWDMSCDAGAAMARDPAAIYWIDVRDGVVAQIIGQYVP